MPSVLLLYATNHGHTAKIATRVAEILRTHGATVDVRDVASAGDIDPSAYDVAILGGSIHAGHHQRPLLDYAKRHAAALSALPAAFFSVCLAAAEEDDESRAQVAKYREDFAQESGWTPRLSTSFAGALQYREYDFMTRLLMRLLMRHGHHPTDSSRDYDFTDWDAVERFAHECAHTLVGAVAHP
jgi:menaquinone-dependent protoporphyrinogen oxidase